jgi:small subunit ribosomal protein S7
MADDEKKAAVAPVAPTAEPAKEPQPKPEAAPQPARPEPKVSRPLAPEPLAAPMDGEPSPEAPKPVKPKKKIPQAATKLRLFGKYDFTEVVVHDAGLLRYINLDPVGTPYSGARHANRSFAKTHVNLVERLINSMMRTEVYTGKKVKAYSAVKKAFEIIEKQTKTNPIQVLVDAIENAAPREEVTRLKYGGISVPKAVDVSSARRLDIALRTISTGTVAASYKSTKSIEQCLANELILAAKKDMNSFSVAKKEEVERVAGSAR